MHVDREVVIEEDLCNDHTSTDVRTGREDLLEINHLEWRLEDDIS